MKPLANTLPILLARSHPTQLATTTQLAKTQPSNTVVLLKKDPASQALAQNNETLGKAKLLKEIGRLCQCYITLSHAAAVAARCSILLP